MMDAKRVEFWGENHLTECMGDSLAAPFAPQADLFKDKSVLEIGPGDGRQFKKVLCFSGSYAIADISPKVLDQPIYQNESVTRYLITDYKKSLGKHAKFDLIHFWYVFHHIKRSESLDFVDFLARHLKKNGMIFFNTPVTDYPEPAYADDGILTTPWTITETEALLEGTLEIIEKNRVWLNATGYVVIARKKGE